MPDYRFVLLYRKQDGIIVIQMECRGGYHAFITGRWLTLPPHGHAQVWAAAALSGLQRPQWKCGRTQSSWQSSKTPSHILFRLRERSVDAEPRWRRPRPLHSSQTIYQVVKATMRMPRTAIIGLS